MDEKKQVKLTGNQLIQLANQERQKLEQINNQLSRFQNFKTELRAAKDALEDIEKNKKGEKMLVNLGAGIYMKASIEDTGKAISALSGNVFKEKNVKEITKILDKKIQGVDKTINSVAVEQQKTMSRVNQMEQVIAAGRQHLQKQRAGQN